MIWFDTYTKILSGHSGCKSRNIMSSQIVQLWHSIWWNWKCFKSSDFMRAYFAFMDFLLIIKITQQSFLQPQKDARISSKGMQITSLKYGNVKRKHAVSKQIYCSRISSIFLNTENKANKATQKTGKLFYNHNANALHWIHTNGTIILQFNNVVIFGL